MGITGIRETEAAQVTETLDRQALGSGRLDSIFDSHFSQGFVAGGFVFVSGQLPVDSDGRLVGGDDVEQQSRKVFENIAEVLALAGSSLKEIVQLNLFLLDIRDIPRIAGVRRELFGDHRPASTAVEVAGLLVPGAKLEVNAVALRGAAHGA
jgi:2-iminobutanoate/2-iminopropanoate deaminase